MLVINRFGIAETAVTKGDTPGHPFRGNQWTTGGGTVGGPDMTDQQATEFEATLADSYAAAGANEDSQSKLEKDVLFDYSNSGYVEINDTLRGSSYPSPVKERIEKSIDTLDKHIAKTEPLQQDLVVFRGVDDQGVSAMGLASPAKGAVLEDKGFMSTSLIKSNAAEFAGGQGAVLQITVPKGTKVLSVNAATNNNNLANEHEFIVPRGSAMVITGSSMVDGINVIQAELIP